MNTLSSSSSTEELVTLDQSFFSLYARLANSEPYVSAKGLAEPATVIESSEALATHESVIRRHLLDDGFCIVRTGKISFSDSTSQLETLFGPSLADSTGARVSRIAVTPGRKYYASTSLGQPMHSDDAHREGSPRVIGLYCQEQSPDGGISTIARLGKFLDQLGSQAPEACQEDEAVKVQGLGSPFARPLFTQTHRRLCSFPSILARITGRKDVIDTYRQCIDWCHDPRNQTRMRLDPGDLILIDNYRVVHGRTPFPESQPRTMLRVSFDGKGLLS